MPYLGNTPAENFVSVVKQDITGNGSTSYTLNHSVSSPGELEVFVNNVQQEPTTAYTVSGSTLTFSEAVASTDDIYVIFRGRTIGTAEHPADAALTATSGSFTSDLTVDTNTLYVDAANNRVGVGTTSPGTTLSSANRSIEITTANGGEVKLTGSTNSTEMAVGNAGANNYVWGMSNHPVIFGTNNTERMRLLSGGGLTFNGDTAAANALDDYEFGDYDITLTPSSSGSITVNPNENKASYVKIGNFVQAQGRFTVSSVSSPAGDLAINLPFSTTSSQGESSGSGAPALFVWNSTQTNNGLWAGFFDKNISAFYIRWGNSSTPGHAASYIQAGTEIRFSVSYITDA